MNKEELFSDKAICKNCVHFGKDCDKHSTNSKGNCIDFEEGENEYSKLSDLEMINQLLKQTIPLSPIERREKMEKISQEYDVKMVVLKEQFKEIKKEIADIKKEVQREYYEHKVLEESDYDEIIAEVAMNIAAKQEDAATEKIVEEIKKHSYIYSTKDDIKSEMWIYDEGIYRPNGKCYVSEVCRKILGKAYKRNLRNDVIAKIEADTFIDQDEFFENKYINEIPVENGILNVITLELSKFTPTKIFFNKLPVKYDKDAQVDAIEKFLEDILSSKEDINVAFELIGSGLCKEYFTEKAGMLVGGGRNGKSKFLELIKRLVGAENCCSVPLRAMKEDNSSLCELYNRLFNLAGDLSHTDLKETGVFKQTVGRDILQAHRKFLRDLHFVNFAKHIFACNELPKVYDTTDGFWDKWILLEFPYKFESQKEYDAIPEEMRDKIKIKDPEIIDKITSPEEMSGLLNKALEGLHRLFKNKSFSQTKGSRDIKDFWIRNSDSFAAFCIDCIEEDSESYISKKELRRRYHRYCKGHKIKGSSDKGIKVTLEDRYGVFDGRKNINEEMTYVWEGIKFKSNL